MLPWSRQVWVGMNERFGSAWYCHSQGKDRGDLFLLRGEVGSAVPGKWSGRLGSLCLSSPLQFVAKTVQRVMATATHQNPRVVIQHQGWRVQGSLV